MVRVVALIVCLLVAALEASCTARPDLRAGVPGLGPLHRAASRGSIGRVEALLAGGARVDDGDAYERTSLHWAASQGQLEVAELLLDRGARIDSRAWYDMQPLHWAALRGRHRVVRVLLARGADPNALTFHRMTALHLAGHAEVVELLTAAGADLQALDVRGMTPMHLARTEAVAQALVDAGADLGVQARDGRRPFDMTLAANPGPEERVVVYPAAPFARLRHDEAAFRVTLMNISEVPIRELHVAAESPAALVRVEPESRQVLHPAQVSLFTLHLVRRPQVAASKHALLVTLTESGAELLQFDVEIDTRHEVTPEDRGLTKVARLELRPPLSSWQYLTFFSPLLLLAAIWVLRRWLVRRRQV